MSDLPESLQRELDRTRSLSQYDVPWSQIRQTKKPFYDRAWFIIASVTVLTLAILCCLHEAGCW